MLRDNDKITTSVLRNVINNCLCLIHYRVKRPIIIELLLFRAIININFIRKEKIKGTSLVEIKNKIDKCNIGYQK